MTSARTAPAGLRRRARQVTSARPDARAARARRGDRGSISPFAIVVAFALILVVGLVVDGGGKIRALQRADAVAAEAARAGGQAVAASPVIRGQSPQVQSGAARAAARAHLAAAQIPGSVTVVGGTRLQVSTSTSYQPVFLTMIGVGRLSATGYAEVRLVRGLNGEQ